MPVQNSSFTATIDDASTVSTEQHEWDVARSIPSKPANWDYGYVIRGQTIGTTGEELSEQLVHRVSDISFVWTPATPEPVFPERVPYLTDAFRRIVVKEARDAVLIGGAFMALGVLLAVGFQDWRFIYRNVFLVFGAVVVAEGILGYVRARHYTQEDAVSDASTARFTTWLKHKRISGYTFALAAFMIVVGLGQVVVRDSIAAAGLVKPAVRNGEIWRLFTVTLMHGSFLHFWLNFLGLLFFSKVVEQTVHRALVPLVFLLTGTLGSVFSVLLYPNTTSVGSSGGLMGLLGFITIACYFDRTRYPLKYFRQMIEGIVLVGALGLFGFAFIDNAAHFGGLGGGLLLGWFFFRRKAQWLRAQGKLLKFAALTALLALAIFAATAVYRMLVQLDS